MKRSASGPGSGAARRSCRPGLTLIEMTVSVAVVSILMVSMSSAILLAGKALPDASSSSLTAVAATGIADNIATELLTAVSVTQNSPTMIEFTVDRSGASHTIRYEWSGTPGDPLTRRYDSAPAVNILEDVQGFTLTYQTKDGTSTSTGEVTSDEIILASFNGWPGTTAQEQNSGLDSAGWAGQFFSADMPDGARKLQVTRVLLKMRQGARGAGVTFTVGIHGATGGGNPEPQAAPIGTVVTKPGSYLPASYEWREFLFSDVTINNPNKEYVIVVKGSSVGNPPFTDGDVLRLYAAQAPENGSQAVWTLDAGGSWEPRTNFQHRYDHPFYVYGAYTTEGTSSTPSTLLELVGVELLAGSAPTIRVQTQVLSKPELPVQ